MIRSTPMAHFLIIFDCRVGKLLRCDEYADSDFELAARDRLAAELTHRLDPKMEIVVLSGPSREVIEMTHGSYFKTVAQLARETSLEISRLRRPRPRT